MCVIDRPETTGTTSARREIRTDRLILRAPKLDDVGAITRLCGDFAIASMTSRMPHPYAETDARQFVSQVSRQDGARERSFAIELPGEGLIGCLGFHKAASAPLEFGYWIGQPYWGHGFATEAAGGALHWAAKDWGRRTVASGHFAGNAASANVLIKSGFLYTGEVQPRHCQASARIEPTHMMVWLA
jgi:RimJ/RimL family protein N-acetyltransferase